MENNYLLNTSTREYKSREVKIDVDLSNTWIEEHKRKELEIDIKERLKPSSRCCIYRAPMMLRNINREAYTPQLISIGPFHYGEKAELINMEKQKIRYKEDFGKRIKITKEKWQDLINFIKQKEQEIRDCYAESTSHFQSHEFIIMILYDAIFIIELFLKSSEENINHFLVNNPSLIAGIRIDLQLLENQLPFFVLKTLYNLAFAKPTWDTSFVALAYNFFKVQQNTEDFDHFVDLSRKALVKNLPDPKEVNIKVCPSAVKLQESGLKFKNINNDDLLNIKFQEGSMPCFKEAELRIPHIMVTEETESWFRNMMALEQCHYPSRTYICNYIYLMDDLINSEKDVDFLVEEGIISNFVGEYPAVAQMFNKLGINIATSESCYKDIVEDLITHHGRWWNRTKATLKSVYFSNLWRGTGTVTGIILLVLTLLQTIDSFWL